MKNLVLFAFLGLGLAVTGCSKKDKDEPASKSKADNTQTNTDNATARKPRPRLRRRPIDHAARAKRLQARLKLSDEQTTKLEDIFKNTPRREQRAKMKELLTPEQWQELNKMRRSRMGRPFGLDPARRAQFMKRRFDLTDDQVAKVTEIFKSTPRREQRDAIKKLLTPEQLKKWDTMRGGRWGRRGSGVKPVPAPPGGAAKPEPAKPTP